jgi:hypothetical protein
MLKLGSTSEAQRKANVGFLAALNIKIMSGGLSMKVTK